MLAMNFNLETTALRQVEAEFNHVISSDGGSLEWVTV
jgi:hypothetical protein